MRILIACCLAIVIVNPSVATYEEWRAGTSLSMRCSGGRVFVLEAVEYVNGAQPMDCVLQVAHVNLLENCFNQTACTVRPLQPGVQCERGNESIAVKYECVEKSRISDVCPSRKISRVTKYIISSNYPHKYPKNQRCSSTMQPLPANILHMTFLDLDMEERTTDGCYDRVTLTEVGTGNRTEYCGKLWADKNRDRLSATYDDLEIDIYTDVQRHHRGFLLKITEMPTTTMTPATTTVTTTTTTTSTTTMTTTLVTEAVISNIDDCATQPCQNGGTCQDDFGVFFCRCPLRFTGVRCEKEDAFDDCASYPCINGGTCEDDFLSYLCHCMDGYSGVNCEMESPSSSTVVPSLCLPVALLTTISAVIVVR